MVCCSNKCAKWTLVLVNLLFFLVGAACVLLGSYAYLRADDLESESEILASLPLRSGAVAVMVLGGVMVLISTCGCIGAQKSMATRSALSVYLVLLTLLILSQLALAVWIYTEPDAIDDEVRDQWSDDDNFDRVVSFQSWLECCGFEGVDPGVPCRARLGDGTCPAGEAAADLCEVSFTQDCRAALDDWLDDNVTLIATVIAVLAVVQLLGLFSAMCLICAKDKETVDQFYVDHNEVDY